jgi:hypothetical protein
MAYGTAAVHPLRVDETAALMQQSITGKNLFITSPLVLFLFTGRGYQPDYGVMLA